MLCGETEIYGLPVI